MALTDENLLFERPHFNGVQRVYRVGNFGLSLVNSPNLRAWPFAWEAAVLKFSGVGHDSRDFSLVYDTPLTNDVEVFDTDDETNAFIANAFEYFARSVAA